MSFEKFQNDQHSNTTKILLHVVATARLKRRRKKPVQCPGIWAVGRLLSRRRSAYFSRMAYVFVTMPEAYAQSGDLPARLAWRLTDVKIWRWAVRDSKAAIRVVGAIHLGQKGSSVAGVWVCSSVVDLLSARCSFSDPLKLWGVNHATYTNAATGCHWPMRLSLANWPALFASSILSLTC